MWSKSRPRARAHHRCQDRRERPGGSADAHRWLCPDRPAQSCQVGMPASSRSADGILVVTSPRSSNRQYCSMAGSTRCAAVPKGRLRRGARAEHQQYYQYQKSHQLRVCGLRSALPRSRSARQSACRSARTNRGCGHVDAILASREPQSWVVRCRDSPRIASPRRVRPTSSVRFELQPTL